MEKGKPKQKVDRLTGGVNIYSLTRPKLEEHCMYLMQKRVVLEDVIANLQKQLEEKDERINKQHITIKQLREKLDTQRQVYIQAITASNEEKQHLSERMVKLESEVASDVSEC